jgi:signal peptidase II
MAGRAPYLALVVALFAADQATKLWVLHGVDFSRGPVPVLPFMDITLVWNRGISYGLFQQDGAGRWLLVALTGAAAAGLSVWLWRARAPLVRLGLAMVIGGALGNLVDRVAYGAVVDFVHLHHAGFSWYVFNVADAAIVIGVAILLVDGVVGGRGAGTRD